MRKHDFRGVVALTGKTGLDLARSLKPEAITLDLRLPDMDGWVLLDQLKHNPDTRHIPVHIISGVGEEHRGLERGAIAFLRKPAEPEVIESALGDIQAFIERQVKHLLVIEDDPVQRDSIVDLIGNSDVQTVAVASGVDDLTLRYVGRMPLAKGRGMLSLYHVDDGWH